MNEIQILLVLPLLIKANINIEIIASEGENEQQILISGKEVDVISNEDINSFQLTEKNLKEAVESYLGVEPEAVYLKSPATENDLYTHQAWKQVNRILKPVRIKVISINYDSTLVWTKLITNKDYKETNFTVQIYKEVENTVDSLWDTRGVQLMNKSISYNIYFMSVFDESVMSMSYTSGFGKNVHKFQTVTLGYKAGMNITLQPKQKARIDLYKNSSTMTVEIYYNVSLTGNIAVIKDHNFWGPEVSSVLKAGRLNRCLLPKETIVLDFNTDFEVLAWDRDTHEQLHY